MVMLAMPNKCAGSGGGGWLAYGYALGLGGGVWRQGR